MNLIKLKLKYGGTQILLGELKNESNRWLKLFQDPNSEPGRQRYAEANADRVTSLYLRVETGDEFEVSEEEHYYLVSLLFDAARIAEIQHLVENTPPFKDLHLIDQQNALHLANNLLEQGRKTTLLEELSPSEKATIASLCFKEAANWGALSNPPHDLATAQVITNEHDRYKALGVRIRTNLTKHISTEEPK